MRSLLSLGLGMSVVLASMVSFVASQTPGAGEITASEVEQQVRASLAAWNTGDLDKIVDTPGISNNHGIGFGWRSRGARVGESREYQLETIRPFFATVEYYRIVDEEIHATVDGDVGFAWGFFTEEIQMPGEALQRVSVRFTTVFKKDDGRLRQVFFHRDAQSFDDQGS